MFIHLFISEQHTRQYIVNPMALLTRKKLSFIVTGFLCEGPSAIAWNCNHEMQIISFYVSLS